MNLREFKERLKKHDWTYVFSDDNRVYAAGLAEERALKGIMKGKVTYEKAYKNQFNKQFNTKQCVKKAAGVIKNKRTTLGTQSS